MRTRHQGMVDRYQAANIEAALIIICDPVKYPPDSLLGQWAALVLQRAKVVDTSTIPAAGFRLTTMEAA